MKTGGLGDVCGALPHALRELKVDARLVMPAYQSAVAAAGALKLVTQLTAATAKMRTMIEARLTRMSPGSTMTRS